jgi:purine-binding chemotaxis protein CheW
VPPGNAALPRICKLRPAPDFSSSSDNTCITGLGTIDERMLILVDIEKLMS